MTNKKLILWMIMVSLAAALLAGCGQQAKVLEGTEREDVLAYTEEKTDNLLAGMNDQDYAAFSRDFNARMSQAIPEASFSSLLTSITGKIGKYVSREVTSVNLGNGIVTVIYNAKFEQEDDVTITATYETKDDHQLSGLYFKSPMLAAK